MTEQQDKAFMSEALNLAQRGIELGDGGPFGAVVVVDGQIIGRGWNQVVKLNDPTAHAEMLAIRDACTHVNSFHLPGSILYTTCEPCPMCLSAVYWAHIEQLVYAAAAADAAAIGFSDSDIKTELEKPSAERLIVARQYQRQRGLALFRQWQASESRINY
ncbi:MAG: nucleoside deaminase [Candidatus Thiodiazotropha sp.]